MIDTPLISVLMACYNSEKYVGKAIDSIVNQTYTNWELIICDDKSIDGTLQILQSYNDPRIKVFENKKNQGYLKNCNKLFSLAKGDYITFQDSDDFSRIDRLAILLKKFNNNPNLGALGSQFHFTTLEGEALPENSPTYPTDHNGITKNYLKEFPFCGASVMITKEVLQNFPSYNEYWDRIGAEDHYWLYLISEKHEVANLKEVLYFYRHNPNSITRNKSNPRKMHCQDFLHEIINQRINTGTDILEQNNSSAIIAMESKYLKPYEENPNLVNYRLATWAYEDNNVKGAIFHIFDAIKNKPFSIYAWKTLFHYFKLALKK